MNINKIHKAINKINSRKISSVIFSLADQNPSHKVQNTSQQINYLQNTTVEVKNSHFELFQGKRHKTNSRITIKATKTPFCQRSKRCTESSLWRWTGIIPWCFPMGKGQCRAPQGCGQPCSPAGVSFGEGVELVLLSHCLFPPPWHCSACVQALGSS